MLLQLSWLLCLAHGVLSACDSNYGPTGTTSCVSFSAYYNQYQWATCLSDTYIKQKSNHKHHCESGIFCYYKCMLEVHGKSSGSVSGDCSCIPSGRVTAYPGWVEPTTRMPAGCLSPPGTSCLWFHNCLKRRFPCGDTTNAYAITYAEKFCSLYDQSNIQWTSDNGKQWMGAMRKCLQVALVPLLRPWRSPSCSEIRRTAFDSHTPCYLEPDQGAPSVCDLECIDFYKIFFTIRGSFDTLDTAWQSLKSMWNVIDRCGLKCTDIWFKETKTIKITKMWIQIVQHQQPTQSSGFLFPYEDTRSRLADGIVSAIAKTLNWNSIVMDWFCYPDPYSKSFFVVLADKKALGIVHTDTYSVNLMEEIAGLASAIKKSTIPVQVHGSNIWIKALEYCLDKRCLKPKSMAVSDKPPLFPSIAGQTMAGNCLLVGISFLVQCWLTKPY